MWMNSLRNASAWVYWSNTNTTGIRVGNDIFYCPMGREYEDDGNRVGKCYMVFRCSNYRIYIGPGFHLSYSIPFLFHLSPFRKMWVYPQRKIFFDLSLRESPFLSVDQIWRWKYTIRQGSGQRPNKDDNSINHCFLQALMEGHLNLCVVTPKNIYTHRNKALTTWTPITEHWLSYFGVLILYCE